MFQLDDNFLTSLGLGDMSTEEKKAFLLHIYEELELRVGTELSKNLSDNQLSEFEKIIQEQNPDKATGWLEANCPDYKKVVADELEKLKQEIQNNKQEILGQAQAA